MCDSYHSILSSRPPFPLRGRSVPPATGYCNIGNGEADCRCASFIIMPDGDAKRQMKRPAPIDVAETSVAHETSFFKLNALAVAPFAAFISPGSNRMATRKTSKKRDNVKPQSAGKLGYVHFDLGLFERRARYLRVPASTDADRLDLIGVELSLIHI